MNPGDEVDSVSCNLACVFSRELVILFVVIAAAVIFLGGARGYCLFCLLCCPLKGFKAIHIPDLEDTSKAALLVRG